MGEIIKKRKYDYSLKISYNTMSTKHVKNNVNKCAFRQKQIKELIPERLIKSKPG